MTQPRKSIQIMARYMERKLSENEHKIPWEHESISINSLMRGVYEELIELEEALMILGHRNRTGHGSTAREADDVVNECADVMNFVHMVAAKIDGEMKKLVRGKDVNTDSGQACASRLCEHAWDGMCALVEKNMRLNEALVVLRTWAEYDRDHDGGKRALNPIYVLEVYRMAMEQLK